LKRIVVTLTATAVAVVASIALSVGEASAWHALVVGQPTCMTDGSGGWSVAWTITNGETAPGHVMTFDSVVVTGKPPIVLSDTSVAPAGSVTGTSDHESSDDSATITVNAVWTFVTPNVRATVSATVNKPADCVPSPTTEASTTTTSTTTTIDETTTTAAPEVPSIQGNVAVRVSDEAPEVEAVQVSAAAAAAAASAQQLPATGGVDVGLVGGGAGLLLIGVALVVASRRRSAPL
jgi:LPXTG-motif cell wall-anchored protein